MKEFFKYRGIVEGFYGKEWTHSQRISIIKFMGKYNYNLYIYAPKTDPFHRLKWKERYPYEYLKKFEDLIKVSAESGVNFSMALSPGLSITHSSEKDLDTIFMKYRDFIDMGVNVISLFFDDIPEELQNISDKKMYKDLASAQADFSNRLFSEMKNYKENISLIVCPTVYHGEVSNYHVSLGNNLNPEINIMWTGKEVCSEVLGTENTKKISDAFKRKVIFWDNYPVNDSLMVGEMHVGAYEGRSPELYGYSDGIILNPMNQAYASMISIADASNYMKDPTKYDSTISLQNTLKELFPDIHESFEKFVHYNLKSPIHRKNYDKLKELTEKFENEYSEGNTELAEKYEKIISDDILLIEKLKNADANIYGDISKWVNELIFRLKALKETFRLIALSNKIHCEFPSYPDVHEVEKQIKITEKSVSDTITFETFSGGIDFYGFCFRYIINAKSLVKLTEY